MQCSDKLHSDDVQAENRRHDQSKNELDEKGLPCLADSLAVQSQLGHCGIQLWSNAATTKLKGALLALLQHPVGERRSTQLVADPGETAWSLRGGFGRLTIVHQFYAELQTTQFLASQCLGAQYPKENAHLIDSIATYAVLEVIYWKSSCKDNEMGIS